MIHREFNVPNYRCTVTDEHDDQHRWLTHANSEAELRQRLERKGYTVINIHEYDFTNWLERANERNREAIESVPRGDSEFEFTDSLWKELKLHLFEQYSNKCAYCESTVFPVSRGDVEHYRPKKGVSGEPGHHGYYWLAYDTKNMLPSCERCNRPPGKGNHFPVVGPRASSPEDNITLEQPLLLNPTHEPDLNQHLLFHPGIFHEDEKPTYLGTVSGRSEAGTTSIEVYKLNRPDLVGARIAEQESYLQTIQVALSQHGFGALKKAMANIRSGNHKYSAAVLAHIQRWMAEAGLI